MDLWILLSVALPSVAGILLLAVSFAEDIRGREAASGRGLYVYTVTMLILSVAASLYTAWTGERSLTLFRLLEGIPVYFQVDYISRLFATVAGAAWLLICFYSFVYMKSEGEEKRYYGLFLLLYGVLAGLNFSGNLVTMYLFFELMTLVSMPMVLHNGSREAIMASLKYLFYSMCGAYGGLFGIVFLYRYCDTLTFTPGGVLNAAAAQGHRGILLAAVFVMIVGFGAKAGMLPLHSWLPAAHPVAPSPASALLSGIIVKFGVLAILRTVYYIVGPAFVRGTWVQYAWMTLALLTVFMGSLLAYREPVLKKRLAYSTVSQVSYILFGLALLTPAAMEGALLHTAAHAFVKCGLFLTSGVFLHRFGYTRADQLAGVGKKMPVTLWCYTIFALALTGIPPMGGFVSKWYLAEGSLASGIPVFSWLGPVALLVSALLTAGYLLPISLKGFFPGEEALSDVEKSEPSPFMLAPLVILAALALLLGILPNPLIRYVSEIALTVLS